jgi:Novel STAND NTPase 1/WD domain, G-beta repeat
MKSPFKFLDSYTKDDRDIFFGRDREIEELYQRVFDSKLLLVYGVSGTGKSSLIHCGLANKFQETDWLPLLIRRGGNIIESMAAAIKTSSITEQQSKFTSPGDFKKGVRSLYLDHYKPVFLIFDQFEELFIFGDKEERRTFISIVKLLTESDLQCRMIFVMREEYMAGITEFEKYIPTIFTNRVRIEKMSHRNALNAIKEPCKVFNISLEESFAETLLEKLSPGESDVELTYLQVFLDKIFRLAISNSPFEGGKGDVIFTLALLEKTGNVSDLLGSFLDEQISLLADQDTALTLLKSFVSVKGTKQPMTPEDAREYALTLGREIKEPVILDMIQTFVNLRILCDKDQHGRYELRHDALAAKIYEKFTMAEKELLEVRKYVENAFYTYEKRGILLTKQDLEYLDAYENKLILPQNLTDFVKQSRDKQQKQRHALKRITWISTLIFILILAITLRFYISTQQGNDTYAAFESAIVQSITDPVKGLIAELDLWEKDSSSGQLHSIILKNFQSIISMQADTGNPIYRIQNKLKPVELESVIINAEMSNKGNYIFGWTEKQNVFIYNLLSGRTSIFKAQTILKHLEISERDSSIALLYENNKASVFNFDGEKQYDFTTTLNDVMNENLVCFFPSGDNQIAAVKGKSTYIYNHSGSILYELKGHSAKVNSLDISPDGRFIVTASSDKNAYIWNYNPEINNYSIYDSLCGHNNIIWSCRFNKTGKYIITASEDSTIKIWDLNGKQIDPEFKFIISSAHFRHTSIKGDEDASDPYYSKYYGKFCDASFSPGELEIIATGYTVDADSLNNVYRNFYKVLFFDGGGGFPYAFGRSFFIGSPSGEKMATMTFSNLVISPNEKVAAAVDSLSSQIFILTGTSYIIATFTGSNPMFSNNGKELFWISGEKIFRTPIHPGEIKKLIESISEVQSSGETKFIVI